MAFKKKRRKHNLSNYHLTTFKAGELIPAQVLEVLPGDTVRLKTNALVRTLPLVAPVMHQVNVRLHHFFVPNRLVWDGWEDFITGGKDGQNSDTVPTLTVPSDTKDTLFDYFGIRAAAGAKVNALPFRAYNAIYNSFYIDYDLQSERNIEDTSLAHVNWAKDYFTTSRPWLQRGQDITIPLGDKAPVKSDIWVFREHINPSNRTAIHEVGGDVRATDGNTNDNNNWEINPDSVYADLKEATGITVTEFREFFALQRYAEARARFGSKYVEYLRYLGLRPADSRLQIPEYLGGGKSTLQFSEVLQTSPGDNKPVGHMAGHGISAMRGRSVTRFIPEHGYIITLATIQPRAIYQDGVQRTFLRQDKEDFYQIELERVGAQPVYKGEVYLESGHERDIFGYQERYADYSFVPSRVTGDFKSTLDFWHFARKFSQSPNLNDAFVKCVPTTRVFSDTTEDSYLVTFNNAVVARRLVNSKPIGALL